jgi:hypothetical protein
MTIDEWQKILSFLLAAVVGPASMYISLRAFRLGNKNSYREEYKFAKSFLEDLDNNPRLHKFVRHKGYQAMLGDQSLNSEVIEYLIKTLNPVLSLEDYVISKSYLKHSRGVENFKLEFESDFLFSTPHRRNFFLCLYFTGFSFSYFFATFPLFTLIFQDVPLIVALLYFAFTLPVGLTAMVFSIREFDRLRRAGRLLARLDEELDSITQLDNWEEHY